MHIEATYRNNPPIIFNDLTELQDKSGIPASEVFDYFITSDASNKPWTMLWKLVIVDDELKIPEDLIQKDIMVLDYINKAISIYDDLELVTSATKIPSTQALYFLNIDRPNKYLAGYELFYLQETNFKVPKFLDISQETATEDNIEYLKQRLMEGLHYDPGTISTEPDTNDNVVIYQDPEGNIRVEVYYQNETVWMTQKQMAELFGIERSVITKHILSIFETGELDEKSTCAFFAHTTQHGAIKGKTQTRSVKQYNLDVIISVGYRVNSKQAVSFRRWASELIKEYLIKGFAMDDKRMMNNDNIYHKEMVERIRDIRSSERQVLQKLKELLKLSTDYNQSSQETLKFFATVQNKLHYASHGHTAAEVIYKRADASKHNAGMTNYIGLVPSKEDAKIAKSYLDEIELSVLNRLTSAYLDYAEIMATRGKLLSMKDWLVKIDEFIAVCELAVLEGKGSVARKDAVNKAIKEFEQYVQSLVTEYSEIDVPMMG